MSRNIVLLIQSLLCSALLIKLCHGQGLAVIGPNKIRPYTPYRVVVSNFLTAHTSLMIKIVGPGYKQQKRIYVKRDTVKNEVFKIGNISEGEYCLEINSASPNFRFEENVGLIFNHKTESIFIQLDKPLYKPGDLIKFRIIAIDIDTRPVTHIKTVNVSISDGKRHLITQWPFGKLENGVFESSFQIASSPNLGKWTMIARAGKSETRKQFELKEYILPHFHVKVTPGEILIASKKQIILLVEASYTFGGPVKGNITVDLFLEKYSNRPSYSNSKTIEGQTTVEFTLSKEIDLDQKDVRNIKTSVTVVDSLTKRTEIVNSTIPVYENPYNFTISKSKPFLLPGINVTVKLNIKDHNGVPASPNNLATIYFEDDEQNEWSDSKAPNSKGDVEFELTPKNISHLYIKKVKYDTLETPDDNIIDDISTLKSTSKMYLKVTLDLNKNKVRPGKRVTFDIECSEQPKFFTYIFMSRGSIIDSGTFPFRKSFGYTLPVGMAPAAKLIVMFMKNFLIYDTLDLIFDQFDNDFQFSLDLPSGFNYKPAQICYVDFQAAEDSYIAFHAIDQSVLRISQSDHLFTTNDLLKDLELYEGIDKNVADQIYSMGLFLRSTVRVDSDYGAEMLARYGSFPVRIIEEPISVRTEFPETWLWNNHMMEGSTRGEISSLVPDSLTTWLITGFALSPTYGLGLINQPVTTKVERKFFIVANLPYSVKRKEVAVVEAIVFNKLGAGLTVQVKLNRKKDDYEFYEKNPENKPKEYYRMKTVFIENNNAKAVSFLIEAKTLGEITINIEAFADKHTDSVEHILRVIPESQTEKKTDGHFIELPQHSSDKAKFIIDYPRNIDPGSFKLEFTIDPVLIGIAFQNLDHLIDKPVGCCEQSMIKFIPNIVLLDYLTATDTVDEAKRNKLQNYLKEGYQNQMKCLNTDGSFSIFRGKSGSVFLTAFIAKSLKIAGKYIDIDPAKVTNAFNWLSNKQKEDGRFIDEHDVFMRDMQGATRTTSFALTAYVVAALLETEEIGRNFRNVTDKSIEYLESNFVNMNHPYDLAITSYAMSLAKRDTQFLDKLIESSIKDTYNNTRYWNHSHLSIEIAGYALLTKIKLNQLVDSSSIMRWLNRQRYSLGGFDGTQSTFVGLKAMADYMEHVSSKTNTYDVLITSKNYRKQIAVKRDSINIQSTVIDCSDKAFNVEVTGIGLGYYQFSYQYSLNILNNTQKSFNLAVDVLNTTNYNILELNVCMQFNPRENEKESNMVLVEVSLPSGIIATDNAVQDLSPRKEISEVEVKYGGTFLNIYYTNVDQMEKCFKVTAERRFRVAMHRPSYVFVYDYVDDRQFAIQKYEGKIMQPCDICDDEDCTKLSCL